MEIKTRTLVAVVWRDDDDRRRMVMGRVTSSKNTETSTFREGFIYPEECLGTHCDVPEERLLAMAQDIAPDDIQHKLPDITLDMAWEIIRLRKENELLKKAQCQMMDGIRC